jgi:hypothetical protein
VRPALPCERESFEVDGGLGFCLSHSTSLGGPLIAENVGLPRLATAAKNAPPPALDSADRRFWIL